MPSSQPITADGLQVRSIDFTVEKSKQLLVDVGLTANLGTLTALIGPSGAGKSTLAKIIAGSNQPTRGLVLFQGHDLHSEYAAIRNRVGIVPQDDVLHKQLTVRQGLRYAAELRLPSDTTAEAREQVIDGVLAELSLTQHAQTRVDRLSGGQRKRASIALELLTGPTLLILDEPTSGLDPALDRQVMSMLRELANAGRVVIVVTHSLTHLDMCDHVLLLAPGGKTAYHGPPSGVEAAMGSNDWAEIFVKVTEKPDEVFAAHRLRTPNEQTPLPVSPHMRHEQGRPAQSGAGRQMSTLARRQVRLILADRGYLAFLLVLPFVLGILSLVVPGKAGFGVAGVDAPSEAGQLLVLLILGACFMGSSISVRDLVGERPIYQREQAAGLLPPAYLAAKIAVFCSATVLQSAALLTIVIIGKNAPKEGALLPSGAIELFIAISLTASCCVLLGLAMSALARSNEQVMPLLVVTIMAQLVMCGGLIPITGRVFLEQVSWLFPSRWGYAATASTIDLRKALGKTAQEDPLWVHEPQVWLLCVWMLTLISIVLAAITWIRLQRSSA
ncbi:MAG: ATP-binding cassette domain-containing protein [Marmoricola sp.]